MPMMEVDRHQPLIMLWRPTKEERFDRWASRLGQRSRAWREEGDLAIIECIIRKRCGLTPTVGNAVCADEGRAPREDASSAMQSISNEARARGDQWSWIEEGTNGRQRGCFVENDEFSKVSSSKTYQFLR